MDFMQEGSMWLLYLGLFIAPFVQEDSAVIGAASLSVSQSDHWISIFAAVLAGLIASDSWKYWLGWAAKHHDWAKKFGEKKQVIRMKEAVVGHSIKTLFTVRFVPMARIPAYLATGFFGVPYHIYWLTISFSGLVYVSVIFTSFHVLGEIFGQNLKTYMPLVALGITITIIGIFAAKWLLSRNKSG